MFRKIIYEKTCGPEYFARFKDQHSKHQKSIQIRKRNDPGRPLDHEIENIRVVQQHPGYEKAGQCKEQTHPHRPDRVVECERFRAKGKHMRGED